MHKLALIGTSLALLGGCANWNSIHHDFKPDNGDSLSIDAKQRVVYTVTKTYGKAEWKAICAEPSPDALSALSASLGVDAAVASKALGVAFSSQEAAASIGLRTQTIQTLRDAMYRLCEGYASGAIDDIGFARLQRRYQAIMLGLLSIEQLTGAVVANQAVLSGSATTRLGQNLSQITVLVSETRAKSVAAKADLVAKTAALETAQKEKSLAEGELKRATDEAKGAETDKLKTATTTLKEKSAAASAADEAKKAAALEEATQTAELANLESLRKDLDRATAIASTTANLMPVSTGAKGPPDSAAFIKVAETVKDIVTTIVEHDYSKETCMDAITSRAARNLDTAAELDLFELQLNYCAFAIRDRAANIGSRSRPLSDIALKSIIDSAETFTTSAAILVDARKKALAERPQAAAAAASAASAPKSK
jgi:hypothetical protein